MKTFIYKKMENDIILPPLYVTQRVDTMTGLGCVQLDLWMLHRACVTCVTSSRTGPQYQQDEAQVSVFLMLLLFVIIISSICNLIILYLQ